MLLLGCKPPGRSIEQHDIFFGIAAHVKDLIPAIIQYWPEANGRIHVDAWQEVKYANGYEVLVGDRIHAEALITQQEVKLFFINLGGYKPGEFEEYHYKLVVAATGKADAVSHAKKTAWFRHTGYKGARAHIDDKYGIDVDDIYALTDILHNDLKEKYSITLAPCDATLANELHIGYFKLNLL
jgi:hypothetical protein